jgi:D-alanyl-D-alanine carboxypeptidase
MAAEAQSGGARAAYASRIAAIARDLEIPADYGPIRHLGLQFEAASLESIGLTPEGAEIRLTSEAATAWRTMDQTARAAGITLLPISGFRSVDRQVHLFQAKRAAGETVAEILRLLAAPGYSEHHTGQAIDIGAPDEPALAEGFGETAAFRWLADHGAGFGFRLSFPRGNPHQIAYEPWHWCFIAQN